MWCGAGTITVPTIKMIYIRIIGYLVQVRVYQHVNLITRVNTSQMFPAIINNGAHTRHTGDKFPHRAYLILPRAADLRGDYTARRDTTRRDTTRSDTTRDVGGGAAVEIFSCKCRALRL